MKSVSLPFSPLRVFRSSPQNGKVRNNLTPPPRGLRIASSWGPRGGGSQVRTVLAGEPGAAVLTHQEERRNPSFASARSHEFSIFAGECLWLRSPPQPPARPSSVRPNPGRGVAQRGALQIASQAEEKEAAAAAARLLLLLLLPPNRERRGQRQAARLALRLRRLPKHFERVAFWQARLGPSGG